MGESLDKLEEFRPDGLASRILGFGDIVGLMQDFEQVVDEKKAEEDAKKLLSGNFSMKDFVEQIRTVRKMGPLKDLLEKFPVFGEMTEQLNPDEKELGKIEAMYDSMTEAERLRPSLINDSRMSSRIFTLPATRKLELVSPWTSFFTASRSPAVNSAQRTPVSSAPSRYSRTGSVSGLRSTSGTSRASPARKGSLITDSSACRSASMAGVGAVQRI